MKRRARARNVYDFDHTIYRGDASFDFIVYCLLRRPKLWKYVPHQALALGHYLFGSWSRKQVKQQAFAFLRDIDDINAMLVSFWGKRRNRVAGWYDMQRRGSDIIISASPEFLLRPIVVQLHGATLLATRMDASTGIITGENCRAAEKVRRLREFDPSIAVKACYSDSLSDMPILDMAQRPYIVKGSCIVPLLNYKPSRLKVLRNPAFIRFLLVGGINAFFGVMFSYVISLLIANPLIAFAFGYALSLIISYFLNAAVTFRELSFSVHQFISFCLSYIPNFIIIFGIVHVLVDILKLYPLIGYAIAAIIAAPVTFLLLSKFTFGSRRS